MTITDEPLQRAEPIEDVPHLSWVTPEVPERVMLPRWLDPNGLELPTAIAAAHAEAVELEQRILDLVPEVHEILSRALALGDVVYELAGTDEDDRPQVPETVRDALTAATGLDRVRELLEWVFGIDSPGGWTPHKHRDDLDRKFGAFELYRRSDLESIYARSCSIF